MSTKLTTSPRGGYDLVDSRALKLTFQLDSFRNQIVDWLLSRLKEDGFTDLTAKQLAFLGELDCGSNHASELARRLGVSRQAIHKSVVELNSLGWLEAVQNPNLGNQKVIEFTDEGERLMARARHHFSCLDDILVDRFGTETLDTLSELLEAPL